jgi:integrase/recombinase XerD
MARIKMQDKKLKNIEISTAWEEYEKELKVRGLSQFSIITKNSIFKNFSKFCNTETIKTQQLNEKLVNNYILWLMEKGNKNSTINSKMTNFKPFVNWCIEKEYCKEFKIKSVKVGQTIKPIYSINDLEKILEKPNIKKCSFAEYRNWVLCNYFLATGNRLNSVVNIKIGDIDFDNNLVKLSETKNKKEQIIPITIQLSNILKEYMTYRKGEPNDYLFVNIDGKPLKRTSCQQAIIYYIKHQRGVEVTSVHAFRRTFATMYVENGGNLFALQQLMGHSKLETTRKYVNLSLKAMKENYEQYNPLDKFINSNKKEHIKMKK